MKKFSELLQSNENDLNNKLSDLKKELIILNAKRARGTTLEKPALIKNTRKTIARILTILKSRENQTSKSGGVVKKNG